MSLAGFTKFGESTVTNDIKENLISFVDYGLLEKEAFVNVTIPTTGINGGLDHRLRLVDDPRYTTGQVWEGFRSNWVWESGVGALTSADNSHPGVSGVYINNAFYPTTTTGIYSYDINHPLGRVIFDSAISSTSIISCSFSYKYVHVSEFSGLGWFKQIQRNSELSENENFINNSGEWNILSDNRVQLPAIGIELVPRRKLEGFALGGGRVISTDFILHCVAEDSYTRDLLVDVISLQDELVFNTYDLDDISLNDSFPLNYNGVPVSGALTYPNLVKSFPGNRIRITNTAFDSIYSLDAGLHIGSVKITTESVVFGV